MLQRHAFVTVVPVIAKDKRLLKMSRIMGTGIWLRLFESRSDHDRGTCQINQVYSWIVYPYKSTMVFTYCGIDFLHWQIQQVVQLSWYLYFFELLSVYDTLHSLI